MAKRPWYPLYGLDNRLPVHKNYPSWANVHADHAHGLHKFEPFGHELFPHTTIGRRGLGDDSPGLVVGHAQHGLRVRQWPHQALLPATVGWRAKPFGRGSSEWLQIDLLQP